MEEFEEQHFEKIRVETKNRIVHVILDQPPENFFTHQLLGELETALEQISSQIGLLAVMVSAGGPNFSSGFDYAEHSGEVVFSILERYRNVCNSLLNLECPTLAVVDGRVRNWGCDLLFFFDMVLASSTATFQYDHLATGAFPPFGTLLLPERMGHQGAFQFLLEGQEFSPERAREIGLVSAIYPREEMVAELKKIFALLSSRSAPVLALVLRNLRRRRLAQFTLESEEVLSDYLNLLTDLEDYNEGIRAWVEKRAPAWKNQ